MAMPSSSNTSKGPVVDPGLCRCCRSIKKCRLLTVEYNWMGKREVYSDMFMDCFGLLLSHLDVEDNDTCICATCVVRLRDACAFREQVLQCEQALISTKLENKTDEANNPVIVKEEPVGRAESDCGADDRDADPDYNERESNMEASDDELWQPIKEKTKTRKRVKKIGKRELKSNKQKLRVKLDKMLETTEKPKKRPLSKKTKTEIDNDDMVYKNAVTIAHYSYVCPFQNRISYYYCFYCKDQFTNPAELREHTLTHNPKEMFECSMINKKIPKIDITRIDCRLCDEKISDLATFKRHIVARHEKVIYPVTNEFLTFKLELDSVTCTECSVSFPYFDTLKKHMTDHFGTFVCHQCGTSFLEQNSLRTHIKSHSKVDTNFPCEVCGKNLKSKYSRYLHVLTVHEKKPTVNCYKCDASFLSYALRNRHLIEVHGDKRTFPCQLCDKVYNRRKTLMEHNRRNHLKVYRHLCELCDQRFYLPSRLKEHMATHTGERNFRCEFCDKSYPRLQSLQEHARAHADRRRALHC